MNQVMARLRTGAVVFSALLATEGVAALAASPVATAESRLVATTAVNIRSGPSTDYRILGVLYTGQSITATGPSNNGWTPVSYNGHAAFIASEYLSGDSGQGGSASGLRTTDYLNVRTGPGTTYRVLDVLAPGTGVVSRGGNQYGWTPIVYNGMDAWVSADYLTGSGAAAVSVSSSSSNSGSGMATTTWLNLRTGPSTDYGIVTVLPPGTAVSPTGQQSNGFTQVNYGGTQRWLYTEYLSGSGSSASANSGATLSYTTSSGAAQSAVNFAMAQLGKPYSWGGTGPYSYDCSGLVQAAYATVGIWLPRTTYQQVNSGRAVSVSELQPGDLVFYNDRGHVGIYIGNGKIVNAENPEVGIVTESVHFMAINAVRRVA